MSLDKRNDTLALYRRHEHRGIVGHWFQFDFDMGLKPLRHIPVSMSKRIEEPLEAAYKDGGLTHKRMLVEDGRLRFVLWFSDLPSVDFSEGSADTRALQQAVTEAVMAVVEDATLVQAEIPKPQFEFALIDRKEQPLVEVNDCPKTRNNLEVVRQAENMYLERLAELQAQIQRDFMPLLELTGEEIPKDDYWEVEEEVCKKYPRPAGLPNLYYS